MPVVGRRGQSGQTMTEYMLIAVAIAIACIAGTELLGTQLNTLWNNVVSGLF